ncbi:MAG: hypothetical protein WC823_07125 [Parcubacteria group bacterium]|jgi:hypothetical protein
MTLTIPVRQVSLSSLKILQRKLEEERSALREKIQGGNMDKNSQEALIKLMGKPHP